MAHSHESYFGPPSDPIDIALFIQYATLLEMQNPIPMPVFSVSPSSVAGYEVLQQSPEELKDSIVAECSVAEVKTSIENALSDPTLYAHMTKTHDTNVYLIYEHADTSGRKKRKRPPNVDPQYEPPAVNAFQQTLDDIKLKSWPVTLDSALFLRASKTSDLNALTAIKTSAPLEPSSSQYDPTSFSSKTALISYTVYNRLTWGHNHLSRSSQHALLATQTLSDLFEVIPCSSNEIPNEIIVDDKVVGFETRPADQGSSGCVICIEGRAYGDGMTENDYADKLISHFERYSSFKREPIEKSMTSIYETPLSSLTLCLNKPYYLLHQGNCEHFFVIDQIRLLHPSDPPPPLISAPELNAWPFSPPSSPSPPTSPISMTTNTSANPYPLTLQITPPLLPLCRACAKVPAIYSIVGDIRLGESPCVLCKVCWREMGDGDDDVIVAPLPRYEIGW